MRSTTDQLSETIHLDEDWPGALILSVSCSYELLQKDKENATEVIISRAFPCLNKHKPYFIVHHIPILWTHFHYLDTAPGILQSVRFPNLSILYNSNQTLKFPHFTPLTPIDQLKKQLKLPEIKVLDQQWYQASLTTVIEHPSSTLSVAYVVGLGIAVGYLYYQFSFILRLSRKRSKELEKDLEAQKKEYLLSKKKLAEKMDSKREV